MGPKDAPKPRRTPKAKFDLKTFLAKINGGRTVAHYPAGQQVFVQGDPANSIFQIKTGRVKLVVVSKQGRQAVVGIMKPSEFFGEGCLVGQKIRMSTAETITECTIMRFDKEVIVDLIHREITFAEMFLGHILARNINIEADLADLLFNSSEKRLARMLLLLANIELENQPEIVGTVVPKISQETLAGIVGTTRSRISVFMNRFRKLGFIDYNGGLKVKSSLLHVVLHD